jgi:hypothetical protein
MMTTIVFFENDVKVSKVMTVENEPVKAAAFYDMFAQNEKLEEFVRKLAQGNIDDPESEAQALMDVLNFS